MSITISVTFTAGIYSGHSGGESPFPPSPARMAAAFLNEISRREDPAARQLLSRLCASGSPTIIRPPAYSSGAGDSFMQPLIATGPHSPVPKRIFEGPQRILGDRGGKISKVVNGHWCVTGPLHYVWESIDLTPDDIALMDDVAGGIPYFGRECDLASIRVTAAGLMDALQQPSSEPGPPPVTLRPSPVGSCRLRDATPGFLAWLDDRYKSLFSEGADQPVPVDHRVTTTRYASSVPMSEGDQWLEILAFRTPLSLTKAMSVAATVDSGEDGIVFPVTRTGNPHLDGRAVGLGILTSRSTRLSDDFDITLLGEDSGLRSLQPGYWTRPARRWMTSVPSLAHPDRWVAEMQVKSVLPEAVITGISTAPLRPSQAKLGADDDHRAWHITLTTPDTVRGPLILDRGTGSGVLMPDYVTGEEE